MAIIKTFSCLVIFLKILDIAAQLHNPHPKIALGLEEEYFKDLNDRYTSSMEESGEIKDSKKIQQNRAELPATLWGDFSSTEEQEDEPDDEEVVLNRTKRRIFPGVGKALDRDRGSRNPWIRGRESFDEPQRSNPAFKRSGPMGSDLLYALYPDLAPPDWSDPSIHDDHVDVDDMMETSAEIRARKKEARRKIKKEREIEQRKKQAKLAQLEMERQKEDSYTYGTPSYHAEEPQPKTQPIPSRPIAKYPKKKGKIPKHLKEEIAKYAEENGVNQTLAYYRDKVDFQLRRGAIEKYVRRYKRRKERQRLRRLIRS